MSEEMFMVRLEESGVDGSLFMIRSMNTSKIGTSIG